MQKREPSSAVQPEPDSVAQSVPSLPKSGKFGDFSFRPATESASVSDDPSGATRTRRPAPASQITQLPEPSNARPSRNPPGRATTSTEPSVASMRRSSPPSVPQ